MKMRESGCPGSRRFGSLVLPGLVFLTMVLVGLGSRAGAAVPGGDATLDEVRASIVANGYSWTAGPTEISDLSPEDFQKLLGARLPESYYRQLAILKAKSPFYSTLTLPARFDWTDSAAVSPVRRQLCGDCWAQCAVGAMESQLRIRDHDNTRLSVQQGIDCNFGGSGCDGGWWEDVYNMYRVVGAVKQSSYTYVGADGTCAEDSCTIVTQIDGWDYIDTTVESIKSHLMTDGPIAVGFTCYSDFDYYTGGCYEHTGTAEVNHGVVIVGWDDSKCSGTGAWHVKNSWGTGWGEAGYFWAKYGTCRIGEGAVTIRYTPRQRTKLEYSSYIVNDSSGDNDGKPDPGESVALPVSIRNRRWQTATNVSATITSPTPGIHLIIASASFPAIGQGQVQQTISPHFSFSVDPSCLCGERIRFLISVACDQGVFTDAFEVPVGDTQTAFFDNCETDLGWTLSDPDDGATAGAFARKNPTGSFLDSILVQNELDHSPGAGIRCYVTGNTARYFGPDFGDVDGGKTTLTSPVVDLSQYASAQLIYWKWYSGDTGQYPPDDVWQVDASGDSGRTWVNLETDGASASEWVPREFNLRDYGALGDKVRVRFIASDFGQESTVEASVDDIEITGSPFWVDTAPPSVQVIAPNGGEELGEATDYTIRWHGCDDYGIRRFLVLASYDGGATFPDTIGAAGPRDSSLVWHVPSGAHPNCLIRIQATDRGFNASFDDCDSAFSIGMEGAGVSSGPDESLPGRVVLVGSESNPFTNSTHIFFGLPARSDVRIAIYDAQGRLTRELANGTAAAGYQSVVWDGKAASGAPASSGVYFIRLEAGHAHQTAKVVLAR
jgi:hypothetical protein